MVYVDDFKLAGPKEKLPLCWKLLGEGSSALKIEPPKPIKLFLGCQHEVGTAELPNGTKVRTMTWNIEDFMQSCVHRYIELGNKLGETINMRKVATPFLTEKQNESPQGRPSHPGEGAIHCPWCRHAFHHSESISDADFKKA